MTATLAFSQADLVYLADNFVTLARACARRGLMIDAARDLIEDRRLPQPSYVLDDGTEIVPPDYFRLLDDAGSLDELEGHFLARYDAAGGARG